jgi:hypothetical protein
MAVSRGELRCGATPQLYNDEGAVHGEADAGCHACTTKHCHLHNASLSRRFTSEQIPTCNRRLLEWTTAARLVSNNGFTMTHGSEEGHYSHCLENVQPEGTARCTMTPHNVPRYSLPRELLLWNPKLYAGYSGVRVLLLPHLCCSDTPRLVPDDRVHAKWIFTIHAALLELSFLLNHAQPQATQGRTPNVGTGERGPRKATAVLHMF